jgi:tetratricopeptide (TPR) repeat protein
MNRTEVAWRFALVAALCAHAQESGSQSKVKEKSVNLLRLPSAAVEKAPDDRDSLRAATDEDSATTAVFDATKTTPVDIVYGFGGATVSPEKLVVRLPDKAAPSRVEILISSSDTAEGFRSLYTAALKPVTKRQEFQLPKTSARWILLRWAPIGAATQITVADVSVIGVPSAQASVYPFTKPPIQALEFVARLKAFSTGRRGIAPDEAALFAEAENGKLDKFSFAEAALIASGVMESAKRQDYLKQLEGIEADAKKAVAGAKTPLEKGDALLKFLHAGPMKNKYAAEQTTLAGVLDTGTFNCVSSAVLYNVIGRRLGLDLRGIEVPDHAFSILYDGDTHADVETTNQLGFNPQRDPRVIKEFEKQTGFRYIPEHDRDKRREIGDLGLVAVMYSNRSNEAGKEKNHYEAVLTSFGAVALDSEFPGGVHNARASFANWSKDAITAGRFPEALAVLEIGLELDPKDSTLAGNRQACWQDWLKATHAKEGEVKAKALAQKLLKDHAGDSSLQDICESHVGRIAKELCDAGRFKEALAYLDRYKDLLAKSANPDLHRQVTWQDWIKATDEKQGEEKARDVALQLLKENPSSVTLREITRSHVVRHIKERAEAEKFEEALGFIQRNQELVDKPAELRQVIWQDWLKATFDKQGEEKGRALAVRLLKENPMDAGLREVTCGQVIEGVNGLKNAEKFEEGVAYVVRNKELLKDEAESRSMIASVYDAWARTYWEKDWDHAIAIYKKGLKVCPMDQLLETNLKYSQAQKKM